MPRTNIFLSVKIDADGNAYLTRPNGTDLLKDAGIDSQYLHEIMHIQLRAYNVGYKEGQEAGYEEGRRMAAERIKSEIDEVSKDW